MKTESRKLNIGVVGATGMVGNAFIKILEQRKFPLSQLKLFASPKSKGTQLQFRDQSITVDVLKEGCFKDLDVVFFSSGNANSKQWAPIAVKEGAYAIDNSSAFRMSPQVPLIVPEVNGHILKQKTDPELIANPNCSTIQMVLVLGPLQKLFGIENVKVATYQSVSGVGKAGVDELESQTQAILNNQKTASDVFPHQIAFNCIPQIGDFESSGFCTEEIKMINETRKILGTTHLSISAFTVRVPALNSHSEALWVTLNSSVEKQDILKALESAPGVTLMGENEYPHAAQASNTDPVYVGRVHKELDDPKTWMFWVVSDNIRKGAALNGLQIAEQIFDIDE